MQGLLTAADVTEEKPESSSTLTIVAAVLIIAAFIAGVRRLTKKRAGVDAYEVPEGEEEPQPVRVRRRRPKEGALLEGEAVEV